MIGLVLGIMLAVPPPVDVTFGEHIAPIVFKNCTGCHRPGQAGPFSLITYRDVSKRAKMIKEVIEDRYMPPWKPEAAHGTFVNERRLTSEEIELFGKWIKGGRTEGTLKTQPPTYHKDGWALGKPDLVLKMDRAYEIPADGPDIYRWFVLKLDLPQRTQRAAGNRCDRADF